MLMLERFSHSTSGVNADTSDETHISHAALTQWPTGDHVRQEADTCPSLVRGQGLRCDERM